MFYRVIERDGEFCVEKIGDGEIMGCHDSTEQLFIAHDAGGDNDIWRLNAGTELSTGTKVTTSLVLVSAVADSTSSEFFLDGSSAAAGNAGTAYEIGDVVTYDGTEYECIQAHTSQVGWEPPNVPALWSEV